MKVIVEPGNISGTITAPPSKSVAQRMLAGALLRKGTTIIHNVGHSADEQAALDIVTQFGASVWEELQANGNRRIKVVSQGINGHVGEINCGESGLAARLFTPIAALGSNEVRINGTGSLLRRPMEGVGEILSELGVTLQGFNGYVPFSVRGPLLAKDVKVNASGGSQLLSGLLFALCAAAKEPVGISVSDLKSKPYIDLTLQVLEQYGMPVTNLYYKRFLIDPALFKHEEIVEVNVEADWSSAAFLLVAGAMAGEITVSSLNMDSRQADRAILDVLRQAGADVVIEGDSVTVRRSRLQSFEFDATDCPDLFPVLAALASVCDGDSRIKGVHRLFNKESNRVESITEMLWNYGVHISVEDDTLCVEGVHRMQGTIIDSYDDHRIVMAATLCALRAKSPIDINGADAVKKSYPAFFEDLKKCGMKCWY